MSPTVTIHPACMALPGLPAKAFADLCESIKAIGLQLPILADADNAIVDGKNRYWACLKVGVAPRFAKANVNGDVVRWVFELNRHRLRKNGQLALAAARLATASEGRPKKTRPDGTVSELTRAAAATVCGISEKAVIRAKFIIEHAVDELVEYLERGEITLGCAEWAAKATREEQTLASAADVAAVRALASAVRARNLAEQKKPSRLSPPLDGMQFAQMAIADLEQIRKDDAERREAFAAIRRWLDENA